MSEKQNSACGRQVYQSIHATSNHNLANVCRFADFDPFSRSTYFGWSLDLVSQLSVPRHECSYSSALLELVIMGLTFAAYHAGPVHQVPEGVPHHAFPAALAAQAGRMPKFLAGPYLCFSTEIFSISKQPSLT